MGAHDEAKLDTKFIDFAKQMNLYLAHFPKHEKYGLSQHCLLLGSCAAHGQLQAHEKHA